MSQFPFTSEANTSCRPSGDHCGVVEVNDSKVTCLLSDPSAFAVQIWIFPVRFDTKAMRRPSGENAGRSSHTVDPGRRYVFSDPSLWRSHLQTLTSKTLYS